MLAVIDLPCPGSPGSLQSHCTSCCDSDTFWAAAAFAIPVHTARALLVAGSTSPVTRTVPPPNTCRKYLLQRSRETQQDKREVPRTLSHVSQPPLPFFLSCFSLCAWLHIQENETCPETGQAAATSPELLISQHMSGFEEPGASILLEMAGSEFLVCLPQTLTRKCPKGLSHAEHSPSSAPPPGQTSSLPTFYC